MGARFGYRDRFAFLRPLSEYPVAQFANLLDGSGLGFMCGAALRHLLVDHIGDLQESLPYVRLISKALVQTSRSFR